MPNDDSLKPEDYTKEILQFGGVYLALLATFCVRVGSVPADNYFANEINMIKRNLEVVLRDLHPECSDSSMEDFDVIEDLLLPDRINNHRLRLKLDGFSISFEPKPNLSVPVDVFLSFYPSMEVGVLLFNFDCNEDNVYLDVNDIIFITQCQENRFEFTLKSVPQVLSNDIHELKKYKIKYIIKAYIEYILKTIRNYEIEAPLDALKLYGEVSFSFGRSIETNAGIDTVQTYLIEIREIIINSIKGSIDFESLFKKFPKELYGLLTGDEGWKFVSEKTARKRIKRFWGSRRFVSIVSFYQRVLFLNLEKEKECLDYYNEHKKLREIQGQDEEEYFKRRPKIAGLTHGPILILEIASIKRFMLNRGLEFDITQKGLLKDLSLFFEGHENIVGILETLSQMELGEMDVLSDMINESLLIYADKDNLNKRLDLLSKRNINIKYSLLISALALAIALISLLSR